MTIVWKALARRDMQKIYAHIAQYAGAARGYDALAEIHLQVNALANQPGLGRAGRKPGTRFLIVTHHDATYRVTYRVRGQRVIILRVRDTRQQGGLVDEHRHPALCLRQGHNKERLILR